MSLNIFIDVTVKAVQVVLKVMVSYLADLMVFDNFHVPAQELAVMKQVLVRMCPKDRDTLNLDQGTRAIVGTSSTGEKQPRGCSSRTPVGDWRNKSRVTVLVSI